MPQLSYINNASVDLNEVCLHVTYLFLKELDITSDFFLLSLLYVSCEFAFIAGSGMKSLFTGIDFSSHIQQSPLPRLLIIFLSLLIFFFKS